jgi:transcriptional regulator with XRE-family HTH domain
MKRFLNARLNIITTNIKNTRSESNYTQEYVAAKLNMPLHDYTELELGKTEMTLNKLFRIAEILNVPILDLIEKDPALLTPRTLNDNPNHMAGGS